jgi:ABC-2 type transport system ATP-binding protein
VRALDDFSLELQQGEIFGLAGPNGAGKSTMIGLMLGFIGPTSGEVSVDGLEPRRFVEQHGVGYLSELVNVPPSWRVSDALKRYALLSGVPADVLDTRVNESIARLGLEEHQHKRSRQLSKGNLQRLGLAQALLSDKRVLVLDEPTHGLDPVWTQRFRDIVGELRSPERTILIASHNLDELERVADRVGIIDRGQLQRIVDMRSRGHGGVEGAPYRLVVRDGLERVLARFANARVNNVGEVELSGIPLEELNVAISQLITDGARFSAIFPVHSALEQQFRDVVGGRGAS